MLRQLQLYKKKFNLLSIIIKNSVYYLRIKRNINNTNKLILINFKFNLVNLSD